MQQSELLQRLNEETLRQGHANDGKNGGGGRLVSEIAAFKSIVEAQPSSRDLLIQARLLDYPLQSGGSFCLIRVSQFSFGTSFKSVPNVQGTGSICCFDDWDFIIRTLRYRARGRKASGHSPTETCCRASFYGNPYNLVQLPRGCR